MKIGICGMGFVGFNLANALGDVVRYSLEPEYIGNVELVKTCEVVFLAVPTPTVNGEQDISAIRSVLPLVKKGAVAVIKSTVLPGTTRKLQAEFPNIVIMHSPEFLREKHAVEDTKFPERNIIGICDKKDRFLADRVMSVLPLATKEEIVNVEEAEMTKYIGNNFLALKVIYANIVYNYCKERGIDYATAVRLAGDDARIGSSHFKVDDGGRGAGGHCFPKDMSAFITDFSKTDAEGLQALVAIEYFNTTLLKDTGKDIEIINGLWSSKKS